MWYAEQEWGENGEFVSEYHYIWLRGLLLYRDGFLAGELKATELMVDRTVVARSGHPIEYEHDKKKKSSVFI